MAEDGTRNGGQDKTLPTLHPPGNTSEHGAVQTRNPHLARRNNPASSIQHPISTATIYPLFLKKPRRMIPLARVGSMATISFPCFRVFRRLAWRPSRQRRKRTRRDSLQFCEQARRYARILVLYPDDSSIISRFSTWGTNPAPIPWILCGPGFPPESTRRAFRLDRLGAEILFARLDDFGNPVRVAARADPGNQDVHPAAGVVPNLFAVVTRWTWGLQIVDCWRITGPGSHSPAARPS